jgi:hypothetical protein
VLAGIWILISPFVLAFQHVNGAMTNNVIFGIVIGLLALYRFMNPAMNAGVSWLNVLFGIWILISPFVIGFNMDHVPTTNNVVMGIVVIILAGWSAVATSTDDNTGMTPMT